ncbi:MAG: asparaginase [Actinomycetota bacterium]|nr:asparaginase [Actinomycetota bacterium]
MVLSKVAVLSLGGTISATKGGGSWVAPTLTGEELVGMVPEISGVAEVEAMQFSQVAGSELTLDDVVSLAREAEARADAAGIVMTQGTDSIEETAFALDLLVHGEAPVVVTGAMRDPTLPGNDGPANLLAAVRVAASEAARGLGAIVVMNDEIHAARFVRKAHTQNPAAFSSAPAGPVGYLYEGRPRVIFRPVGRRRIELPREAGYSPVALYKVSFGDDGRLFPEIERLGYEGLVVEAMGGGHLPTSMVGTLERLTGRMPVVLASRTGGGEVLTRTYGFPGSETDLIGRGLIPAGPLDGLKARILLSLLLRSGASREEIAEAFERPFA